MNPSSAKDTVTGRMPVLASGECCTSLFCGCVLKKTYLRSTILQERHNAVMMMHVHQELTDSLDFKSIAKEFRVRSDYRKAKLPKL